MPYVVDDVMWPETDWNTNLHHGARLLNPDGGTLWFNKLHFKSAGKIEPLFGYTPGLMGGSFMPNGEINYYKIFTDGLDDEDDVYEHIIANQADRCSFSSGVTNVRRYELEFPKSQPIEFQYAIITHWVEPDGAGSNLDDFGPEVHAVEPFHMTILEDNSNMWFGADPEKFGGVLDIKIGVLDWQGNPDTGNPEDYKIDMDCYRAPMDATPTIANRVLDGWVGYHEVDSYNGPATEYSYFQVITSNGGGGIPVSIEPFIFASCLDENYTYSDVAEIPPDHGLETKNLRSCFMLEQANRRDVGFRIIEPNG
jgi:hypothetical protein